MSELVIVKQPLSVNSAGHEKAIMGEQVVGISASGSSTFTEYGYKTSGTETEEALTGFDEYTAGKLLEFYERCKVAAPEDRPFYNCHLLAWFVTGKVTRLESYEYFATQQVWPHGVAPLEAGKTYAVQTPEGEFPHSMVGIDSPHRNISVLGDRSPLAVTDNEDLTTFYSGITIARVIPRAAFHEPALAGKEQ